MKYLKYIKATVMANLTGKIEKTLFIVRVERWKVTFLCTQNH